MKTICKVCGKEGVIQKRGNRKRWQHYLNFKDGKRHYIWHSVQLDLLPIAPVGIVEAAGSNPVPST